MNNKNNPYDSSYLEETLETTFDDSENFNVPKGISRYDYGNTHGWWVRVIRDGAQFTELFSDKKHGSIEESLRAAIIRRHEILSTFPVSSSKYIHPRSLPPEPKKRITRIDEPGRKQRYRAWQARWYDKNHKIKRKYFSITEHGEEEARAMALATAKKNHNKTPKFSIIPDPHLKQQFESLSREDVRILATINSGISNSGDNEDEIPISNNPFGFEGEKKMDIHLKIERDQKLRNKKIEEFINKHGKLFCELCEFNFMETYPFLEKDIIEVHHIVPLSTLSSSTKIELNDLMLLCSNCHFAIHQGDELQNVKIMKKLFGQQN